MTNPTPERVPFEMGEIAATPEAQARRGWELKVNGQIVENVTHAELVNNRMGVKVEYGQRPEGFDGPIIKEPGGGGPVTIPYMLRDGRIYVGVVEEKRAPAGGVVQNVPRGFLEPSETHLDGAIRETQEETGIKALAERFEDLGGGINPNSAFFDTSRTAPDGRPEGASVFALQVRDDEVEEFTRPDGSKEFRFNQEIRDSAIGDRTGERIVGSVFVPMGEAVKSPDVYTSAAAGRLAAHLLGSGVLSVMHVERPAQQPQQ